MSGVLIAPFDAVFVMSRNTPMTTPLDARLATLEALRRKKSLAISRHLIMPEVGMDGQKRLKAASVLLIGAGGLGSPLGLYLAAAGVGRIGLVDFDVVDFSNLQRQVLHGTAGRRPAETAFGHATGFRPSIPKCGSISTKRI